MVQIDTGPEKEYITHSSYEYRKKLGQFFTPPVIANFMVEWVVDNRQQINLLDPALGLGIFFRSITEKYPSLVRDFVFTGYDIDREMVQKSKTILLPEHLHLTLKNEDYLTTDWKTRYDGIICNPPYLKFHDYATKDCLLDIFKQREMKLSGFTNIYSLFLLKSLQQLKPGGRMSYIVPSEFLNADYGRAVKKYLLESGMLRYAIVIDFSTEVFENVLTTALILLLANDSDSEGVEFINIHKLDDLTRVKSYLQNETTSIKLGHVVPMKDLEPQKKWRMYYKGLKHKQYHNLVPFSRYVNVSRGIATGANEYFTFSRRKREEYLIPETCLLPCLTKAQDARKHFFTQDDFVNLVERNRDVYLLNAQNASEDENVQRYLTFGQELGIDQRYLTSHRKPWYSIENRPPAPILVTVFNRSGLRFVKNEVGVYNLTAFHSIYFKEEVLSRRRLLMAYLITDVAREIFADSRREYGGGLKKFEPNDLNNGYVIDLDVIDSTSAEEIDRLYCQLRNLEIDGRESDQVYNEVKVRMNEIFLEFLE